MSTVKKILIAASLLVIVIQFFQPDRKTVALSPATDISSVVPVPDSVKQVLIKACYDCHSNNTRYPWYSYVQPIGWFLAGHIKEGKNFLNFSEFGSYTERKQMSRFDGIANNVRDDEMPLKSYTLIHRDARLAEKEKELLINWAAKSENDLSGRQ